MEFNKKTFLNNIYFLVKERNKKIGDVEKEAGVSAGYISRLNKEDNNSKPSIEFLMSVAESLSVTLDALVNYDFSALTGTERYILEFIEKMKNDTMYHEMPWAKETEIELSHVEYDYENGSSHPLFDAHSEYVPSGCDYPDVKFTPYFKSYFCGKKCRVIGGDCFYAEMPGNGRLYLMKISEYESEEVSELPFCDATGYEIYLVRNGVSPLCGGVESDQAPFYAAMKDLYNAVAESYTHIKINKSARDAIDAFMTGKELPVELPF